MLFEIEGVVQSHTCLLPMVSGFSRAMLRFYGHYKDGRLLRAGGIAEQPAVYLEAMELIDKTFNEIQLKKLKERRRG